MNKVILIAATDSSCAQWSVRCPDYSKPFVDELKEKLPVEGRSWDPEDRVWVVGGDWVQAAADIARKYFPGAEVEWHEV